MEHLSECEWGNLVMFPWKIELHCHRNIYPVFHSSCFLPLASTGLSVVMWWTKLENSLFILITTPKERRGVRANFILDQIIPCIHRNLGWHGTGSRQLGVGGGLGLLLALTALVKYVCKVTKWVSVGSSSTWIIARVAGSHILYIVILFVTLNLLLFVTQINVLMLLSVLLSWIKKTTMNY